MAQYVRNGSVQIVESEGYRLTMLYGEAVFDPKRTPDNLGFKLGKPDELIFYIAGATYYPTIDGYQRLENRKN